MNKSLFELVHRGQQTPAILLLVLASFCVAVLFLPLEGTPTSLPEYLYISVNQKLIVAFVLGTKDREGEGPSDVFVPSLRDANNGHLKIIDQITTPALDLLAKPWL